MQVLVIAKVLEKRALPAAAPGAEHCIRALANAVADIAAYESDPTMQAVMALQSLVRDNRKQLECSAPVRCLRRPADGCWAVLGGRVRRTPRACHGS